MGKYFTELIIEGKKGILDNLYEPYLFLADKDLNRLAQAINILAVNKGYRVVNQSTFSMSREIIVLMEKK